MGEEVRHIGVNEFVRYASLGGSLEVKTQIKRTYTIHHDTLVLDIFAYRQLSA